MFYAVLIVIALSGAYYVGDCYSDRFFTSGEIWTGMVVGMLLPVWVALKKGKMVCSVMTVWVIAVFAVVGGYMLVLGRDGWQEFVFYAALCLLMWVLNNSSGALSYDRLYGVLVLLAGGEMVVALGQWAGWWHSGTRFRLTGTFDNPAGLAAWMAVGVPFALYFWKEKRGWWKWGGGLLLATMAAVTVASGSRTGMLAVAGVLSGGMFLYWKGSRRMKGKLAVGLVITGILAGTALYFWKKDSADGRLLIWRCCVEMIGDAPWIGHGPHGFAARYMDYQADFLERNPEGRGAVLADNVKRPFNELLAVGTDYGLLGIVLVFGGGIWLWKALRRAGRERYPLFLAVGGLALCCMFSYPLDYPAVQAFLFVLLGMIGREERCFSLGESSWRMPVLVAAVTVLVFSAYRMRLEKEWFRLAYRVSREDFAAVYEGYERLYPVMKANPLFLYNYGAELNRAGLWGESMKVIAECRERFNDMDVQMLMGDNCERMGMYDTAGMHYRRAASMCPSRFIPPYRLAKLYIRQGKIAKAAEVARMIVRKPVKVPSYTVRKIQCEMRDFLCIDRN